MVDMDNWDSSRIEIIEDESGNLSIALKGNIKTVSADITYSPCYIGEINEDGTIEGKIPAYVKKVGTDEFLPVTSLEYAFIERIDLRQAPQIPDSVTNMNYTFYLCTSLEQAPDIPSGVENMEKTFSNCVSLTGYITINANPTKYNYCFENVGDFYNPILLRGKSNILQKLANTGKGIMLADFEEWADNYLEGISDVTELENLLSYPHDFTEEDREELKQLIVEVGGTYEELLKEIIKYNSWIKVEYQSYLNGWDGKTADELKQIYAETIGYNGGFSEYLTSIRKNETDLSGLREDMEFSEEQEADFLKYLLNKYIEYGDTLEMIFSYQ